AMLATRLSTSSQTHLYATVLRTHGTHPLIVGAGSRLAAPLGRGSATTVQAVVLAPGGFPLRLQLAGHGLAHHALVRIAVRAVDPWGRGGGYTLSFRAAQTRAPDDCRGDPPPGRDARPARHDSPNR